MGYRVSCIYLDESTPRLKVNAKFGALGEAWLYPELPKDFYDAIVSLVDAELKAHEAKMKMAILAEPKESV